MPRYKDEPPAVGVYSVCHESRYLIVRNVPSLGCGDDLLKLFASYGEVEECKPMDEADCDQFSDVYWIQFRLVTDARLAKRKLDEYAFPGNRLNVSYAPEFETLSDTRDKLESRGREVLGRLNPGRSKGATLNNSFKEYFPSQSTNQTVEMVREKLNKFLKDGHSMDSCWWHEFVRHRQALLVYMNEVNCHVN